MAKLKFSEHMRLASAFLKGKDELHKVTTSMADKADSDAKEDAVYDLSVRLSKLGSTELTARQLARLSVAAQRGGDELHRITTSMADDADPDNFAEEDAVYDASNAFAKELRQDGKAGKYAKLAGRMATSTAPSRRSSGGGRRNDAGMRSRGNATPSVTIRRR